MVICCWRGRGCDDGDGDDTGGEGAALVGLLRCRCGKAYHFGCASKGVAAFFAEDAVLQDLDYAGCGQCGPHAAAALPAHAFHGAVTGTEYIALGGGAADEDEVLDEAVVGGAADLPVVLSSLEAPGGVLI